MNPDLTATELRISDRAIHEATQQWIGPEQLIADWGLILDVAGPENTKYPQMSPYAREARNAAHRARKRHKGHGTRMEQAIEEGLDSWP